MDAQGCEQPRTPGRGTRLHRQSWETLLAWWKTEHEILAAIVDRILEDRLEAQCVVGEDAPVTLRFLIENYVSHQSSASAADCRNLAGISKCRRKSARH